MCFPERAQAKPDENNEGIYGAIILHRSPLDLCENSGYCFRDYLTKLAHPQIRKSSLSTKIKKPCLFRQGFCWIIK